AKYGIIPKAPLAKKAIPNSNLTFLAGSDMKAVLTPFYQVLFNADKTSVGGKLPADDFYYGA
ncbi:MAG: ABC transporter substrate-binding protein, partial [Clostridia bacterium]|nr:ABC transporter substrate-binding protein [Clostridia bacterium]